MKKKIQKYLSGEREGFSLIELIIVIAIMAILIGVIALVVLPYLESARENRDRQTLSEVSNAFKSAMADETIAKDSTIPKDGTWFLISGKANLKTKMEKYMDKTLADAKSGLASDKCKDQDFYAKVTTDNKLSCCIGSSSGPVSDSDNKAYEQ